MDAVGNHFLDWYSALDLMMIIFYCIFTHPSVDQSTTGQLGDVELEKLASEGYQNAENVTPYFNIQKSESIKEECLNT